MTSRPAQPIGETDLQTYIDGRLAAERRAEVESWLVARPAEASRIADHRRLRELCRAAYARILEEAVPEDILAALRPARRRPRRFARLAAAIAAGVIIGALGAWQFRQSWQAASSDAAAAEMVRRSTIAHAVYASEIRHPVDGNAAEGDVLAWLSERLRMKVVAPDLQAAGLAFIGGRLLPGERSAAALLMYEAPNGRRATLYWGPEFRSEHETPLRYARGADGTRVYYWIDEECGYAVASADFSENELLVVAAMAYAQLEK